MVKNGIMLTGAAARISQEVAIIDLLIADGLEINQNNTLLTGYSSGALNLLALNGCFKNDSDLSWHTYYKENILFNLRDKDVFELLPLTGDSVLNTAPFRGFLSAILDDMKFESFGDLPFKSFVITSQYTDVSTHWADNKNPGSAQLKPIDLFMASTAIPVALPPQTIASLNSNPPRNFPQGEFIDGGTWGSFVNYDSQLPNFIKENGVLDELHIISPMRESAAQQHETKKSFLEKLGVLKLLSGVEHDKFENTYNIGIGQFLTFVKGLNDLNGTNQIAKNIYITIPFMNANTGFFDFGKQESTYNTVYDWLTGDGKNQLKVPIADFLNSTVV